MYSFWDAIPPFFFPNLLTKDLLQYYAEGPGRRDWSGSIIRVTKPRLIRAVPEINNEELPIGQPAKESSLGMMEAIFFLCDLKRYLE